jgi:hypothetical protein
MNQSSCNETISEGKGVGRKLPDGGLDPTPMWGPANEETMTEIGVISDTHALMREEALRLLAGVELIIHAGDVGSTAVLDALARIAPVHAVRGNVDGGSWAEALPANRVVEAEGARIFVLHRMADLDFDPAARGFAAVVFGHSHKPSQEVRNGVLYLNPGSAGPRRFRLPLSVARMRVEGKSVRAETIPLDI